MPTSRAASRQSPVVMSKQLRARASEVLEAVFQRAFRVIMALVETNVVPDFIIRFGIRLLLAKRLAEVKPATPHRRSRLPLSAVFTNFKPDSAFFAGHWSCSRDWWASKSVGSFSIRGLVSKAKASVQEEARDQAAYVDHIQGFVDELKSMPVAIHTDSANEQHYEASAIVASNCFAPPPESCKA